MAQPITPCPYLIEENAISTSIEASPTAAVPRKGCRLGALHVSPGTFVERNDP
jgi:hypothetical protein